MGKKRICFVCSAVIENDDFEINSEVLLAVCPRCKGTENEKKKVEEYLDSLADGLVCGCI
ncbi:hypothetical protein SAMN05444274_103251 [Mariniphaga anaerophila]|uniref:Uncharacterized protein n=1 Tax=Mariniphaga anaerophila TaxID=1484053 RepID=A0A1M4Y6S3_9BACT|nr:hypothetical protein [Mariniphaga anaerophila]SHF01408.1 hypothetical protein SAMN05444274_103251 [Mariniphaga anaerophila]